MAIKPFDKQYSRTLTEIAQQPSGLTDVWLFESSEARHAVQQLLAEKGYDIQIRSAYKTLLHCVLEQHLFDDALAVTIQYPVVARDEPLRFRLECYPLQDLFAGIDITFVPCNHMDDDALPYYQLTIHTATESNELTIEVPVRWKKHPSGKQLLVATGWQKKDNGLSVPMSTDYEQIFNDICLYLQSLPLRPLKPAEPNGPFFDQLKICVTAPFQDQALPVGNEAISLAEALHEEICFTAMEIFQKRLGLTANPQDLQPGQVVPMICKGESIFLSISACDAQPAEDRDQAGLISLSEATHWLFPSQVRSWLHRIEGQPIHARSRQGRLVEGRIVYVEGLPEIASLAISGAQHANETSGVVGALRAALELEKNASVSYSVCPVENVDGYALFHRLCQQYPNHMHHAARNTASGNDLTNGSGSCESAIRDHASKLLPARVHVNLHGYPAHEWTRPLSGYVPQGFSNWTIPKGFFLICDYADDGLKKNASQVLDAALRALYQYPEMMAINRRMLRSYERAIGSLNFEIYRNCIPYTLTRRVRGPYPISLITEAPDESIYGEDFRVAHEAQYRVVMAVAELLANFPNCPILPRLTR